MPRHRAFRFRIYPNKEQQVLISKTIGCSRYIFNHFLSEWSETYETTGKGLNYNTCSSRLTLLKKELTWLKEVDSTALQSTLKDLDDAFRRFFKKQNKPPRYKAKKNPVQSYTTKCNNQSIAVVERCIKLPKLGLVRFAKSREVTGRIISATVRKAPSGKYFISILAETELCELTKTGSSCGIDVGLKDFAVVSDGRVYENPKFFRRLEDRLAKEQRILARRKKGSSNRNKQRIKVARIHEKIANARADYLHKISTEIVKNHDVIGIEDLAVNNLLKNGRLAKSISEVSWSTFRAMLEYKAAWYGKTVVPVARNYASSQLCSACGHKHKAVKDLSVRNWVCPECGSSHDRDFNASLNLRNEAIRLLTAGAAGIA